MSDGPDPSVTILLARWRGGDAQALESLTPLVYENLRQIAARQMSREKSGHTLSATALVHEAYLRLLGADVPFQDRAHFLAVAAREMRRVLVDSARAKHRQKRGADWQRVSWPGDGPAVEEAAADVLAIQDALDRLATLDSRKAQVVDFMIFGGLTALESAEVLGISEATVNREWRLARAWLQHELKLKPA